MTVEGDVSLESLLGRRSVDELGYAWLESRGEPPQGDEARGTSALLVRLDGVLHAFWGEPAGGGGAEPVLRVSRPDLPSWPLPRDAAPLLVSPRSRTCQLAWRGGASDGDRVLVAVSEPDDRLVFEVGVARSGQDTFATSVRLDGGVARTGERAEARLQLTRATTRLHLVLLDASAWLVRGLQVGELVLVEPGSPVPGAAFSVHVMSELRWEGEQICAAAGTDVRLEAEYVGARADGTRLRAFLVGRAAIQEEDRRRVVARIPGPRRDSP